MLRLDKKAKKNADYYLAEKLADDCKDHWYRYFKTLENYSEPILVSPSMAQELLDANKDHERPSKEHPTVCISFNGKLLDGFTILKSIALGEESQIVFVSFNISDKLAALFN